METQKQYVLNFVFKILLYIKTEQFLKMNYMYFKDWTVFKKWNTCNGMRSSSDTPAIIISIHTIVYMYLKYKVWY